MQLNHSFRRLAMFMALAAWLGDAAQGDESPGSRNQVFQVAKGGEPILLPVLIGGKPYNFIFDTGSGNSMFSTRLKHLLGGPTHSRQVVTTIQPGPFETMLFRAPPITLAHTGRRDVSEVLCVDLKALEPFFGKRVDGVLGFDAVRDLIVQVNFDRGELSILPKVPADAGKEVQLWVVEGIPAVLLELDAGPDFFRIATGRVGAASGSLAARKFGLLMDAGQLSVLGEVT